MSTNEETLISRFLNLISKKRKIQLFITLLIMIVSAILESITLTLLGPLLAIITDLNNSEILNNKYLQFKDILNISTDQLIIYSALLFVLFIIIGSIIRTLNVFIVNRLSASMGTELSEMCFEKFLKKNYEYHVENNSSQLITIIAKYIDQTVMVLNSFLMFLVSILIAFSILIILLIKQPILTLIFALFFLISYFLIIYKVRPKLYFNNKKYNILANRQVKHIQESLGSIREIKLSSNYNFYTKKHKNLDKNMRFNLAQNNFISQAPKFILESTGLSLIILFAAYLSINNLSSGALLTSLATIALGGLRLLTSLNQAFAYWTTIRANKNGFKKILFQLNDQIGDEINPIIITSANKRKNDYKIIKNFISFNNVSYFFSARNKELFKEINLTINVGEKVGIKGPSGSGKTTFVDLLVGLLKPQSGQILINGIDICSLRKTAHLRNWQSQISYAPQIPYLVDDTIMVNIAIGINKDKIDFKRVKRVAKIAQIHDFIIELNEGYNTVIGERGLSLSGGQRQRIAIARALYRNSRVLILDEATSALDQNTESKVIESIEKFTNNLTLIMIAHRTSTLKNCNKILDIKNGQIFVSEINK